MCLPLYSSDFWFMLFGIAGIILTIYLLFIEKNFLYRLCLFCFQHLDLRIIFHLFNQRSKCSVGGLLDWTSNGKDSLLENLYLLPRKYPLFIPLTLAVHGYCLFFTLLKHHKSLLFLLRLIFIYLFVFVYVFVCYLYEGASENSIGSQNTWSCSYRILWVAWQMDGLGTKLGSSGCSARSPDRRAISPA